MAMSCTSDSVEATDSDDRRQQYCRLFSGESTRCGTQMRHANAGMHEERGMLQAAFVMHTWRHLLVSKHPLQLLALARRAAPVRDRPFLRCWLKPLLQGPRSLLYGVLHIAPRWRCCFLLLPSAPVPSLRHTHKLLCPACAGRMQGWPCRTPRPQGGAHIQHENLLGSRAGKAGV